MGVICEHIFQDTDPKDPRYSLTEYDLYAKLDKTIRKNHVAGMYEIVSIREVPRVVWFRGGLEYIVNIANRLEGATNTFIRCKHQ